MKGLQANSPVAVAALPINHRPIRALPVMIIHGHDTGARLELENFVLRQFPHVALITMINEADAAYSLPEKFERLAGKVKGAIALLTPDDAAVALQNRSSNLRVTKSIARSRCATRAICRSAAMCHASRRRSFRRSERRGARRRASGARNQQRA
jgi:hypothetical protein